ncbi:MAG TPA: hypothetical protein VFT22_44790, partial [Kofleriaceae bacterium]|nr:hypothetical protein [Kofleriaceae bacterium]
MTAASAVWLLWDFRIARELPALAIEHVAREADPGAVVDERALAVLVRELAGARPERAAEILARLHGRGRIDAVGPLVRAATTRGGPVLWRALIAVLDAPAEAHGPTISASILTAGPSGRALAVRALGLAGGMPVDAVDAWRASDDPALALIAEVARLRLAGDAGAVLASLGDAIRDGDAAGRGARGGAAIQAASTVAIEELGLEIARAIAADRSLIRTP